MNSDDEDTTTPVTAEGEFEPEDLSDGNTYIGGNAETSEDTAPGDKVS
jgi:hypothetical protein